ncbi:hypothetical protein C495_05963 [Natronorubrum sulfidifaciens JCM 14089]|uniref:Uncharacterized protein n=1 Tax=Natronorubrum sulfidifaciens JCM 14089 TaxID=1230460 RepID=L9WAZ2_9EURY|nr:hypothetical protein C495_05963 [Natronorubrum sulfidifaciens JCM 14089]
MPLNVTAHRIARQERGSTRPSERPRVGASDVSETRGNANGEERPMSENRELASGERRDLCAVRCVCTSVQLLLYLDNRVKW